MAAPRFDVSNWQLFLTLDDGRVVNPALPDDIPVLWYKKLSAHHAGPAR